MLQIGQAVQNREIPLALLKSKGIKSEGFFYRFRFCVHEREFDGLGFPSVDSGGGISIGLLTLSGKKMSAQETRFHFSICENDIRREIAIRFKQDVSWQNQS